MPVQALVLGGTNAQVAQLADIPEPGSVSAPITGDQATGDFTIATGQFGLQGARLTLASTERGTLEGTGRLVILG